MLLRERCDELLSDPAAFSAEAQEAITALGQSLIIGSEVSLEQVDRAAQLIGYLPLMFFHGRPVRPTTIVHGDVFKKWLARTLKGYQEQSIHAQAALAKRARIGNSRLSQILNGQRWPMYHEMQIIAPAIELTQVYLVSPGDFEHYRTRNVTLPTDVLARRAVMPR